MWLSTLYIWQFLLFLCFCLFLLKVDQRFYSHFDAFIEAVLGSQQSSGSSSAFDEIVSMELDQAEDLSVDK